MAGSECLTLSFIVYVEDGSFQSLCYGETVRVETNIPKETNSMLKQISNNKSFIHSGFGQSNLIMLG